MTDDSLMPFQKLDVYRAAKELAQLVHQARLEHTVLRDQACRAAVSCFLQLAEGLPNSGPGMRRKYFTVTCPRFRTRTRPRARPRDRTRQFSLQHTQMSGEAVHGDLAVVKQGAGEIGG
jgi:hypothetical protein